MYILFAGHRGAHLLIVLLAVGFFYSVRWEKNGKIFKRKYGIMLVSEIDKSHPKNK